MVVAKTSFPSNPLDTFFISRFSSSRILSLKLSFCTKDEQIRGHSSWGTHNKLLFRYFWKFPFLFDDFFRNQLLFCCRIIARLWLSLFFWVGRGQWILRLAASTCQSDCSNVLFPSFHQLKILLERKKKFWGTVLSWVWDVFIILRLYFLTDLFVWLWA